MAKQKLKVDRKPCEQVTARIKKGIFAYSERNKETAKSLELLTNRKRKAHQEDLYLFELSNIIDPRSYCFCSRKQLLALNDYTVPELIHFSRYLNYFLLI